MSWSSKQQPTVATSSSDTEYMAANFAGHEAMWLRQLLTELGYHIPKLTIYCNSQPAIAVCPRILNITPGWSTLTWCITGSGRRLRRDCSSSSLCQQMTWWLMCSQKDLWEWSMRSVELDLGFAGVKGHSIEGVCWDALKYPLLCIYVSLTVYWVSPLLCGSEWPFLCV